MLNAKRKLRVVKSIFGRVHELCFEKNPELAPDNPARKFKGRVVFLGNQVRDQNWEMAMFQELGSNPATMGASKACDCFASLDGNAGGQADATAAYTQADSKGTETWVVLPRHKCPAQ